MERGGIPSPAPEDQNKNKTKKKEKKPGLERVNKSVKKTKLQIVVNFLCSTFVLAVCLLHEAADKLEHLLCYPERA